LLFIPFTLAQKNFPMKRGFFIICFTFQRQAHVRTRALSLSLSLSHTHTHTHTHTERERGGGGGRLYYWYKVFCKKSADSSR
jgi:hypothetical protein